MTEDRSGGGVSRSPTGPRATTSTPATELRDGGRLLDWLEERLGPYPFSSFGILVVDSLSGMETQTMVTLGNNDYILSPPVILHEMAHQWYGDQVTPRDWRDLWMSEGMATYLQATWESEHGRPFDGPGGRLGGARPADPRRVRAARRLRPASRSARPTSTPHPR